MLKKTITYTDFDGVERTEDVYFNLSKAELTEMEISVDGGMANLLRKIVDSKDNKEIFAIFKQILLASVGIKSDDGRRFVKNDAVREDFLSSPTFEIIVMEMLSDVAKAADFVNGIMPSDVSAAAAKMAEGATISEVTTPTSVPTE